MLKLPRAETTIRVAELKWPEEVRSLLEVRSDSVNFVNQILHANNTVLAKAVLNNGVVGKSNALLVDLAVSTLVDKLTNSLERRVTIGDPRVNNLKHLGGGLGELDEDTVVDLKETEELKDLARLRGDLVDTEDKCYHQTVNVCDEVTNPLIRTTKASLASAGT